MIPRRLATTAAFCVLAAGSGWAQQMPCQTVAHLQHSAAGGTRRPPTACRSKPRSGRRRISSWRRRAAGPAQGSRCRGGARHSLARRDRVRHARPHETDQHRQEPAAGHAVPAGRSDLRHDCGAAQMGAAGLAAARTQAPGRPLVRIEAMSSYSCRNAYGRAKSRLSEHGRVNALDIGAFVTARGQTARVVADWGMTAREIAAQAAAAKAGESHCPGQAGARQRTRTSKPPPARPGRPDAPDRCRSRRHGDYHRHPRHLDADARRSARAGHGPHRTGAAQSPGRAQAAGRHDAELPPR